MKVKINLIGLILLFCTNLLVSKLRFNEYPRKMDTYGTVVRELPDSSYIGGGQLFLQLHPKHYFGI
ncbi:MAG: hypothetical protein IPK10_01185 [Bacteroidetes bacterium]|nr:hypothetical protein [Bacteroidota bacterium]